MNDNLFDTSVLIDYLRFTPKTIELFNKIREPIITSITVCELYQGARNKEILNKIKKTLREFKIIHLTDKVSELAVELIENYHLSHGLLIPDALIAATALKNHLILITSNVKDFTMIKGLKVEKW